MFDTPTAATREVKRFRDLLTSGRPTRPYAYTVLLGFNVAEWRALLRQIERGLSWRSFERFAGSIGLKTTEIAALLAIPPRTLARRKAEGRLGSEESERLLRLARVFAAALELFDGDHDAATEWLTTRKIALGDAVPIELARTEIGASEVETLIARLEHGIFS